MYMRGMYNMIIFSHTIAEVKVMNKEKMEKLQQKREQEKFNSVTNSVKPRNQNQEHNVREEGIRPQNNKY